MKPEELKTLAIGDPITVHAEISPAYRPPDNPPGSVVKYDSKRVIEKRKYYKPRNAFFTGWTMRFEGDVDYPKFSDEPGYLVVRKSVKVVRFKENQRKNENFAFFEDVEIGHHGK